MKRSKDMSSSKINRIIEYGLKNGAIGAKLVGAGGGGFILFITQDKLKLRSKMKDLKLQELKFNFDYDGSIIMGRNWYEFFKKFSSWKYSYFKRY